MYRTAGRWTDCPAGKSQVHALHSIYTATIILCWHYADLFAGITVLLSTQQKYDKKLIEERNLTQGCGSVHLLLITLELKYVFFIST